MIPQSVLEKYGMPTLDSYLKDKGSSKEAKQRFYKRFLEFSDYEVIKAIEKGNQISEELKEYRQFARDEINNTTE